MKAKIFTLAVAAALIFSGCAQQDEPMPEKTQAISAVHVPISPVSVETMDISQDKDSEEDRCQFSQAEIELIALMTVAEAEDECEIGKRLVIDTVLNRIDSKNFPDDVCGVIFQPYQYQSMTNGCADCWEVTDDICELVRSECKHRLNSDVIFFNSECYSEYGTPLFCVQNHYFSGGES